MKHNSGITSWELMLFILFLAVSIGSSVFFFIINSSDMQKVNQNHDWISSINLILDDISLEIANSIIVTSPLDGESQECLFKQPIDGTTLETSPTEEGFIFADNNLYYVSKDSGKEEVQRFGRHSNPLITNCDSGGFKRLTSNQLEISFRAKPPYATSDSSVFVRTINLRNQ